MQKGKKVVKRIGADNKKYSLIPNKSLGIFIIGDKIDKYLHLSYKFKHEDYKYFSSNSYDFYKGKVAVWTFEDADNDINLIRTIRCNSECYWQKQNLIGMLFDDFIQLAGMQPDQESMEYVPVNRDRGQNQTVYEFEKLGLQIWVWRKKIRTVIIYKYVEDII
jgi:hypothetical protein